MSLGWNFVAPLVGLLLPRDVSGRRGRAVISGIYRMCWATAERLGLLELDSSALDSLRDEPGGLIVAANHPSMLDALVVVARLPRGVCVMKAELMRNVFLGGGARLLQRSVAFPGDDPEPPRPRGAGDDGLDGPPAPDQPTADSRRRRRRQGAGAGEGRARRGAAVGTQCADDRRS